MLENLMTNVVNVNRPTPSKGTSGGQTNTYATVYSALPCSFQPVSASWLIQYAQRAINVTNTLYFNSNPTILIADQIIMGSHTFLVQGVRDLIASGRVLVVDVLEVT